MFKVYIKEIIAFFVVQILIFVKFNLKNIFYIKSQKNNQTTMKKPLNPYLLKNK